MQGWAIYATHKKQDRLLDFNDVPKVYSKESEEK